MPQWIQIDTCTPSQSRGIHQVIQILYVGLMVLMGFRLWSVVQMPVSALRQRVLVALLIGYLILLAFVMMSLYQERRPPRLRVALGLLGLRVLMLEGFAFVARSFSEPAPLYLITAFTIYPYLSRRIRWLVLVGVLVRSTMGFAVDYQGIPPEAQQVASSDVVVGAFSYLLIVVLVAVLIEAFDREARQRQESERLLAELRRLHDHIGTLATAEERNRLAREIHDSLGHYLTAISIQLETAATFQSKAPEVSSHSIADARRLTREALREVRDSVASLRSRPALSLETQVRRLVTDHVVSPPITVTVQGNQAGFPEPLLRTLYRITQEAVTNIRTHAGASHAEIDLRLQDDRALLVVRDDGCGFDPSQDHHRFGLVGIRERVEQAGGSVEIVSQPGQGTCVRVEIPRTVSGQQAATWSGGA